MLRRELRKIRQYCLCKESNGDVVRLLTDQAIFSDCSASERFYSPYFVFIWRDAKSIWGFYMVFIQGEMKCCLSNLSDFKWCEYTQLN